MYWVIQDRIRLHVMDDIFTLRKIPSKFGVDIIIKSVKNGGVKRGLFGGC